MKTFANRGIWGVSCVVLAISGVAAIAFGAVACDDNDPEVSTTKTYADGAPYLGDDDAAGDDGGDDDSSTPYMGPTTGGTITLPSMDGSSSVDLTPPDGPNTIDTSCCNLTFVYNPAHYPPVDAGYNYPIDDAGSDADAAVYTAPDAAPSAVYLEGDAPPLGSGVMLPMTMGANGVWSLNECVAPSEYLRYRFYLGMTPVDPTEVGGPMVPVYACDPNNPVVSDGMGGCYNTLGPIASCASVDASTGMLTVGDDH